MFFVADDIDQFAFKEVEYEVDSSLSDLSYLDEVAGLFLREDHGLLLCKSFYLLENISEFGSSFKVLLADCCRDMLENGVLNCFAVSFEK